MKLLFAPILMMLLLTQAFSKWVWVLEYELNKDYIAQTLCVNKENVELKCKGKCQLMKKLAEEEQQEKNNTTGKSAKLQFQEVLFVYQFSGSDLSLMQIPANALYAHYQLIAYPSPVTAIFHPPAVA